MKNSKILIVGAGPTGLTLANLLIKMEVPFLLIDKALGPTKNSKAFAIQSRSLEIFDKIGIGEKAIEEGNIDNTLHLIIKNKEAAKINFREILPGETPFPYVLILQQNKTEQILINALKSKGKKVNWGYELTYLEQKGHEIKVRLRDDKNSVVTRSFEYVIGCDGVGSTVRELEGFTFKGHSIAQTFYLADAGLQWKYPHSHIYFLLANNHLSAVFSYKEEGKYRLFNFMNSVVEKDEEGELSKKEVQRIFDSQSHIDMKIKDMAWSSVFKIQTRLTTNFRKGNVFLAGDAGHVHSPVAGQGMNTGIQDTFNLAWKLKLVLNGKGSSKLLDTYEEERFLIAQNLHKTTDRFFRLIIKQNPIVNFLRLNIFPWLINLMFNQPEIRKKNLRRISQLSIKYRYSSLSREGRKNNFRNMAPKSGDRAPFCRICSEKGQNTYDLLNPNRFTLFIFFENKEDETQLKKIVAWSKREIKFPVEVFVFRNNSEKKLFNTYGVKKEGMFLIRPDNHIGYRSSNILLTEIENYLSSTFLIPEQ